MKNLAAFGLVAACASVTLAHPLRARQGDATLPFETCQFDRFAAFQPSATSSSQASKRRACEAKHHSSPSSSQITSAASTSTKPTSSSTSLESSLSTRATATAGPSSSVVKFASGSATTASKTSTASAAATSAVDSWDPPSSLATALEEVWNHEISTYSDPLAFMNYGYDHLMDTEANIQYCVRWDSAQSVTAEQRASIETALQRQYNKWVEGALASFDGFPYTTTNVKVTGWATNNTALLEGDIADGVTVHSSSDTDGIPQCDPACGRYFHYADGDYSSCSGGDAARYDVSLWLTDGMDGVGAGGDWGQRIGTTYMLENLESENIHILLHEMGHTLALDDFYDWTPTGVTSFIMLAGSATEVTEFDAWMARDWWRNLKSRYNL
ncbi:hypothetical protein PFICI_04162 [Pestalotiopsis fici W106-1]|uniref:Cellulose-binding family II protein n=1 Tax=Pestalotiopsis fici (strain W106-1 / CGMCC3.15140) TaxID=1229662 RepID=W3XKZ0_PESFW|nr:uncharacterized protein PFICI_04162 [Pestalotiopsis fici W106-1]ETS86137.1 hypothetical protein PFICI_04162 [Pestalotiopsis fici W106-1]